MVLFFDGVVRPRVKQLVFQSGIDYGIPTTYRNDETEICEEVCEADLSVYDLESGEEFTYEVNRVDFYTNWPEDSTEYSIWP